MWFRTGPDPVRVPVWGDRGDSVDFFTVQLVQRVLGYLAPVVTGTR